MPDRDLYIELRKNLDSFTNVSLAEYDLSETTEERQKFVEFIAEKIQEFKVQLSKMENGNWKRLGHQRAKDFEVHAEALSKEKPSQCPPGFHEINGICEPI